MSAEGLSLAANVLQVVGFADTIFRAGTNLYELFAKARTASRNVTLLLSELQTLLRVIANIRMFLNEHAASLFANEDSYSLHTVKTILTLIEHDFRLLKNMIAKIVPIRPASWYLTLMNGIRWALDQNEVDSACQRLSRYTSSLTAALSVSGR
jgi:hypothetical protein